MPLLRRPKGPFQIGNDVRSFEGTRYIPQLRMGLGVEAAGLAAVNCPGEDLESMQKALEDMKGAVAEHQLDLLVEADLRFHRIICIASTNPHFVALFDFLGLHLKYAITQTRRSSSEKPPHLANTQRGHEMIFFAINTRNAEAARAAARLHVLNTPSGSRSTPTTYAAPR